MLGITCFRRYDGDPTVDECRCVLLFKASFSIIWPHRCRLVLSALRLYVIWSHKLHILLTVFAVGLVLPIGNVVSTRNRQLIRILMFSARYMLPFSAILLFHPHTRAARTFIQIEKACRCSLGRSIASIKLTPVPAVCPIRKATCIQTNLRRWQGSTFVFGLFRSSLMH